MPSHNFALRRTPIPYGKGSKVTYAKRMESGAQEVTFRLPWPPVARTSVFCVLPTLPLLMETSFSSIETSRGLCVGVAAEYPTYTILVPWGEICGNQSSRRQLYS